VEIELLNLEAIARAPITTDPFSFFIAPGVLSPVDLAVVRADFPPINEPGGFCLSELIYGPAFAGLIEEISGPKFKYIIERKYGIDLSDRSMVISVCNHEREQDGGIRTDLKGEFVTCLLYLNSIWNEESGMLHGRNGRSDVAVKIPPSGSTLASFLRFDNSQLTHEPYRGELRCVMLTWTTTRTCCNNLSTQIRQRDCLLHKRV
jgi:SM-20-related protein